MPCQEYTVVHLPECVNEITVVAGLTPLTEYLYTLSGDSETLYEFRAATGEDGNFVISSDQFPPEYFNRFSGSYELRIYTSDTHTPVPITLGEYVYDYVLIYFIRSNQTTAIIG